jgi:hypothetical protein
MVSTSWRRENFRVLKHSVDGESHGDCARMPAAGDQSKKSPPLLFGTGQGETKRKLLNPFVEEQFKAERVEKM